MITNSLCFIAGFGAGAIACFIILIVFVRSAQQDAKETAQKNQDRLDELLSERNAIGRRQANFLEEIAISLQIMQQNRQ